MEQAREARAKFEANAKLTDAGAIRTALRSAQTWLHDHIHPEPITNIYNYGGLAFQRDAPYPLHVRLHREQNKLLLKLDIKGQ